MKTNIFRKRLAALSFAAICLFAAQCPSFADNATGTKYCAIPLAKSALTPGRTPLNRYGVPFIKAALPFNTNGSASVAVGGRAQRIFLLGMTDTSTPHSWTELRSYADRYFIGDDLGKIRLEYADGSTQVFPLVLGESIWWGAAFYKFPEPFQSDAHLRRAFRDSLRLYPPAPVQDSNYVAVIVPKNSPIKDIVVENSSSKLGHPVISGMTVETAADEAITNGLPLPYSPLSPDFAKFAAEKPLCQAGENTNEIQRRLEDFQRAFYTTDESFKGRVAIQIPPGYSGPKVSFKGDKYATILEDIFYANVQDMNDKVTPDGMYHTSTKGAANWGIYSGFGTYTTNVGKYYGASWTRDMGRSLQELTELGYTNDALRCADYCFRSAQLWEESPAPKYHGHFYPPHWGRVANRPHDAPPYENDGHGLTATFIYELWQRLPDRDEWLRAHWPDVQAAGDWILWQFAHPEISGATNGILYTTSESSAMRGYSVYPDCVCMNTLRAFAQMADSIGQTNSAIQWRDCADQMQAAIATQYTITDPKYGRVWTLHYAGWPNNSTVLGPLIFVSDYRGFAPEDENDDWRSINEAAYQRLIDTYQPFGFYGQAMGYGQGFVTQAALLLDRMSDATTMLHWAAKEIYEPRFGSFIVPEGCDIDPTGRYWYRIGDLGNGVQEGEIIKTLRLVIGVDDTRPDRLQFYPRMPFGWNAMSVDKYPVLFESSGINETTYLHYQLKRTGDGMKLEIGADNDLGMVAMRLGPFKKQPRASDIRVNGQNPPDASVGKSGDSWWVKFNAPVGGTK